MSKKTMNRLLQQIAQLATPPDFDLWERIERQVTPKVSRRPPLRRRASVSFALAGAMLIIFVALWWVHPKGNRQMPTGSSPTPTPTLAATTAPAYSFQGVVVTHIANNASLDYIANVWYSAPNRFRYESYVSSVLALSGSMPDADLQATAAATAAVATPDSTGRSYPYQLSSIDASDGQRRWLYYPQDDGVSEQGLSAPIDSTMLPQFYGVPTPGQPQPDELISRLSANNSKVTVLREDTFLNRPVYVIQMQPKAGNNPGLGYTTDDARIIVWIDKQTWLELKYEYYFAGNTLRVSRMFTSLQFNATIDPSIFRLKLPENAWINPFQQTGYENGGHWFSLDPEWHRVAQAVPFSVYEPIPLEFNKDHLLIGRVSYDAFSGVLSGPVYSAADPYGPPVITITEVAGSQTNGLQGIPIRSANGYNTIGFYTVENGTDQLIFVIRGTVITMRSTDPTMTDARLISLANDFQFAPPWYQPYEVDAHWQAFAQQLTYPLYATETNSYEDIGYALGFRQTAAELPIYSETSGTVSQAYYDNVQPIVDMLITEGPSLPDNLDLSAAQGVRVGVYPGGYYLENSDYRWLIIHAPGTYVTLQARANVVSRDDLFLFGASFQRVTPPSN